MTDFVHHSWTMNNAHLMEEIAVYLTWTLIKDVDLERIALAIGLNVDIPLTRMVNITHCSKIRKFVLSVQKLMIPIFKIFFVQNNLHVMRDTIVGQFFRYFEHNYLRRGGAFWMKICQYNDCSKMCILDSKITTDRGDFKRALVEDPLWVRKKYAQHLKIPTTSWKKWKKDSGASWIRTHIQKSLLYPLFSFWGAQDHSATATHLTNMSYLALVSCMMWHPISLFRQYCSVLELLELIRPL